MFLLVGKVLGFLLLVVEMFSFLLLRVRPFGGPVLWRLAGDGH